MEHKLKIAQVAPLMESVPPKLYGGTERVVSYLTEELVRLGHDVTLFASGDSVTRARLHASVPRALRLDERVRDPLPHIVLQLEQVRERAREFDILHFHSDLMHFPLVRALRLGNTVTTMHGRIDLGDYRPLFETFCDAPLVSISQRQRDPLPHCDWIGTVHHGLPDSLCRFTAKPRGDYIAFLGRVSPEKRADRAIEICARAGMKLRIAAKVDSADREYFEDTIAPLLDQPHVEFVGEIGDSDNADFLGNSRALVFPIDWPEPFGLVMIEAMACGTPCVAWRAGSVPEVLEEGKSGFIVESIDQAVAALETAMSLDRHAVRACFEERFSAARMTRDYVDVYRRVLARGSGRVAA
jgi:glycosyltransferase involved in cell wall biosynthesis